MQLNLSDHVAVVTGGASGIGRAIGELFASEGCKVALWDVSPGVSDVARELSAAHKVTALGCVVDVTRRETIEDNANMVIFLSSDRAAQVTGQTLNVDGGFVLHW